ncbi:hypothetical protein VNO77_14590 [Canavalia gladiata]|uniref:Uncharacterized protein n=1 Tax=Canavalia gladiata TaxID=3824 RepID=A0AAN9M1Z6_CANGL
MIRLTNKDIIAQVLSASIAGDNMHAAAYSHKPPCYGLRAIVSFGSLKRTLDGVWIFLIMRRGLLISIRKKELDVDVHCKCILEGHVAAYMKTLLEDER